MTKFNEKMELLESEYKAAKTFDDRVELLYDYYQAAKSKKEKDYIFEKVANECGKMISWEASKAKHSNRIQFDDLFQSGTIAVLKIFDKGIFNPEKGRLYPLLKTSIKNEIYNYIYKYDGEIRIPVSARTLHSKIRKFEDEFYDKKGFFPKRADYENAGFKWSDVLVYFDVKEQPQTLDFCGADDFFLPNKKGMDYKNAKEKLEFIYTLLNDREVEFLKELLACDTNFTMLAKQKKCSRQAVYERFNRISKKVIDFFKKNGYM